MIDAARAGELDVLLIGGRQLHGGAARARRVSRRRSRASALRVHIDIVLSPQMLVDPAETVMVLPAATRYEIAGGVTETSTERRVIFSPGDPRAADRPRRAASGRSSASWRRACGRELAERRALCIRRRRCATRSRVIVPLYAGIERLRESGDQFQYGGERLCEGWQFPTPDGRARFSVVAAARGEADDGRLRADDPARQAVQLDGAGAPRRDDGRRPRRRADQRPPTPSASASPTARRCVVRSDHGRAARPRADRAGQAGQRAGPLARGQRAHRPRAGARPQAGVPDYNARVTVAGE